MDNVNGTNGMDNMDTLEYAQPGPTRGSGALRPGRWSGRTKRIVTTVAASTVLLGSGAAIGVVLTGGASASTGSGTTSAGTMSSGTTSTVANMSAANTAAAALGRCAKLTQRLQAHDHPLAAAGLRAFCRHPLLRLALVAGEHGEVTYQTSAGPKTVAFERGTIQAVSSSAITVLAKDGTTWTWNLTSTTKIRETHDIVGQDKLSTGETVLVAGPVVGGSHDARLIRIRDGKSARLPQPANGS